MAENYLVVAKREIDRLNREIEGINREIALLHEAVRRNIETIDAWDTIVRNAGDELQAIGDADQGADAQQEEAQGSDDEPDPVCLQAEPEQQLTPERQPEPESEPELEPADEPELVGVGDWKTDLAAKLATASGKVTDLYNKNFNSGYSPSDVYKAAPHRKDKFQGLGLSER